MYDYVPKKGENWWHSSNTAAQHNSNPAALSNVNNSNANMWDWPWNQISTYQKLSLNN